ncbi:odorant receptor 49b-like isoform X1 [Diorhabda carinulata]|uniref:odorant receptor 49b-like isoform X1 n=1 Tax=Diorhabda carinulata TaxID=1163345 RepID=UPI0025A23DC5|nr:odorant receptor 49b-like isoform X1 [Diorhabda carinulata]
MLNPGTFFFLRFVMISIFGSLTMASSILHVIHTVVSGQYNRIDTDLTFIVSLLTCYVAVWAYLIKMKHVTEMYTFLSDFNTFGKPKDFDINNDNFNKYSRMHYIYLELLVCILILGSNIFDGKNCRNENVRFNLTEVCGLVTYTWLPFDIDYTPVREIYLLLQILGTHHLYMLVGLMAWQVFEVVQHIVVRIRDIKHVILEALSQEDPLVRKKQFHFAIRYHNALFGLVDRLNEVFSIFMFTHMVVASIIMGIGAFTFLHSKSLTTIMVCTGWFWGLFMDCISGQRLQDESSELAVAVYNAPWYECNEELKKDILFVLYKCQKCQVLYAGAFGIMDRPMFLAVLKLTYSYITLLGKAK